MRLSASLLAVAALVTVTLAAGVAAAADDPYLWLEDVDGARAMDWVRAEDARTAGVLDKDPRFEPLYRSALALAEAKDRIPEPSQVRGGIYNNWQDGKNVHGLWRRTTLTNYRSDDIKWTTVLDLDALSAAEHANWFWSGAQCAEPAERRCVLSLSDGGEDAVTVREFDLGTSRFVAGGFSLPKGKQDVAWQDENTLWVSREWAPGELTDSGYAYVVKRLARGKPLSAAEELYAGQSGGTSVRTIGWKKAESGAGWPPASATRAPAATEAATCRLSCCAKSRRASGP